MLEWIRRHRRVRPPVSGSTILAAREWIGALRGSLILRQVELLSTSEAGPSRCACGGHSVPPRNAAQFNPALSERSGKSAETIPPLRRALFGR